MTTLPFYPANILLPKNGYEKWATVACDQFTSQPEYWHEAERIVGSAPSALRITLPEIYLGGNIDKRIENINAAMREYLDNGVFNEYRDVLIYVERTLPDGKIRHGIVGNIDLDAYSFEKNAKPLIRPTEGTVLERIPPRVKIRRDAPLELPHVMLLIDDPLRTVIEPLSNEKLMLLYDFDLMLGGGHIRGYLVPPDVQKRVFTSLGALAEGSDDPFLFAVGDGNHSLATAKTCRSLDNTDLSRYALTEVVNIHDDALVFEPIYRVLFGIKPAELLDGLNKLFCGGNTPVEFIADGINRTFCTEGFPVGILQDFLDEYVGNHDGAKIDYIHGEDVARELAVKEGCAGFIFGGMEKSALFPIVSSRGVLPRKSFSMGEAASKRYYIESRLIRNI